MAHNDHIEHEGIVEESIRGRVKVRILSQSACASCHARGACSAADQQEKLIDVVSSGDFKTGERVILSGEKKLGLTAAWWAYILPLILVMGTLSGTWLLTRNEELAGLLALGVLVPYFVVLKLLEKKFTNTFSFSVKSSTHPTL